MNQQQAPLQNADMDIDEPNLPEGAGEIPSSSESQTEEQIGQGQSQTPQSTPQTPTPQQPASEQSQTPVQQGQQATQTTGQGDDDELSPRFKERIEKVTEPYKTGAENWNLINRIAAKDPKFALTIIEKMESEGALQKGSFDAAKAKLQPVIDQLESQSQQTPGQQVPQVQGNDALQKALEEHPDVQYARQLREKAAKAQQKQLDEAENFFKTFESDKPDIAQTANPAATRQRIFLEAQAEADKEGKPLSKEHFDKAYKFVLHRDEALKEIQQNGRIDGEISAIQQTGMSPTLHGTTPPSGGHRALTAEEKSAAQSMGATDAEYLSYLENPNKIFEDLTD